MYIHFLKLLLNDSSIIDKTSHLPFKVFIYIDNLCIIFSNFFQCFYTRRSKKEFQYFSSTKIVIRRFDLFNRVFKSICNSLSLQSHSLSQQSFHLLVCFSTQDVRLFASFSFIDDCKFIFCRRYDTIHGI